MTSITSQKNLFEYVVVKAAQNPKALTSASTAIYSTPVDRTNYLSGVLAVNLNATAKAHGTAKVVVKVQHSSISTGTFTDFAFDDKTTSATVKVGTTASTATQTGVNAIGSYPLTLTGAKKYVRVSLTPTVTVGSSTVTAVAQTSAVFVFGGANVYPVT
jgi:hypothetical protein